MILPSRLLEPTSPIVFFFYLMISILSVVALDRNGEISELGGVALSTVVATALWLLVQAISKFAIYGRKFVFLVNAILALKIVLGLLHFYLLFAPAAGITSAGDSRHVNFSGDFSPIFFSAQTFMSQRESSGLLGAIFFDYYRAINNPGVGVVYGLLFGSFGEYATVAVPWNALAMGFAAMALGAIGTLLKIPLNFVKTAIVLTLLMPSFLIGVPVYRDQFMILLILLTTFASLHAAMRKSLTSVLVCLLSGLLLASFRLIYVALPIIALGSALSGRYLIRTQKRITVGSAVAVMGAILVIVYYLKGVIGIWFDISMLREVHYGSLNTLLGVGGGFLNYIGRGGFILLTPMPWWQGVDLPLLVYQVFDYGQTFLSLMVFAALFCNFRRILEQKTMIPLLAIGFFIFLFAVAGSELHQRYAQVALPLLILSTATILRYNWLKWVFSSTLIITASHFLLQII